ncbi:autotransporter family protein [Burkholderia stagnalis]|uniref:autotransporter family protein n=1 Tax=Burkholderia stagnalis TaxID=1503054 RepID=UPI000F57E99D|nr:autotransporter outer membrane beta-barrel domain-containing protein [Burkholderia stagnalis]RQQ30867.1 autotransporter outer membrane beta-barrel domain-containing protein [Burkholderia stagnalis]RQQ33253.1 autotransporter outer membrane beta-barrel domain-containing protein [Burkholderia stagnalis]RQQ48311.1 autotransporter outer membrane beta-barrel domain-containing protein [Burkholderia stagnalis]RQY48931.1 autotransporter outer membrane beta-barrel domain-containing protein [Burkholder
MNAKFRLYQARAGRRLAQSALLAGAVVPWPSSVAEASDGSAQRADGVAHEVAPGDYSTTAPLRPVFSAVNGGVLTTTGKTRLFSSGNGASGAAVEGAGSRIEMRDTEIRTRGILGAGIDIRLGGSVLAENSSIDTDGDYAHGVYVDVGGSRADIAGSAIVTRGSEAHGIAVNNAPGAIANVADTLVRTGGQFAYGVFVSYDDVHATLARTDIRTTGDFASTLFMPGASVATFSDSRLETDGYAATGVDTRKGQVELARTRVFTHGESAHGLYTSKEQQSDPTPLVRATDTHVVTSGARSIGAVARLGGRVEMTGGGIATSGERAYGMLSSGAGSIASIADGVVTTGGRDATALHAGRGGTIDLLRTDVRATGDGAYAAAVYGGRLTVDGGSLISEQHGAIGAAGAIVSLRNGARAAGGNGTLLSVDAQSGAPVRLTLDSGAQAAGDIVNQPTDDGSPTLAVTDVALSRAAAWAGATDAVRALSLDSDSRWTVTADSTVGSVVLNDSTIAFSEPGASTPRVLAVIGDYAARNGRLLIHTTLRDDASPTDKLVIDGGHASGNTGIVVKRTSGDGAQTTVGIPVVETRNGGTTDTAAFALDAASDGYRNGFGTLSAGGYDYMLARGGQGGRAEDWYLVSTAKPEPPIPPAPAPGGDGGDGGDESSIGKETTPPLLAIAPEPDAYLANADAAAMMAIHTLHQREDRSLRSASGAPRPLDGAAWLRAEGQFTSMSGGNRGVSGNGRLIHAGADLLRFDDGRGGSIRVGAMGMYGSQTNWSTRPLWNAIEQRITDATARGSVAGYNVGLYGTWYGNRDILSGPYVDAWFMYGAYANSVGGSLAADSYRSRTVTGSIETGYSLRFYERGDTRFFVEPEAQLVVSDYRADAHDTPGGRLDGQGATDVLTRLGVRVHGVTAMSSGRELRPFIEANWWHGPGSRSLTLDRNAFSFSVPRDRAAVRIGATGQVARQFSVSASLGVEGNLSDYSVVKGQLSAKYRW